MSAETLSERNFSGRSLAKKVLLAGGETANLMKVSYVFGLGLGLGGRAMNNEWILPFAPVALDIAGNGKFIGADAKNVLAYAAYGAGVATAHADRVYSITADLIDKLF